MRFKLDENVGASAALPLRQLGHDVDTALDEGLRGQRDTAIFSACMREGRVLVTFDKGFGELARASSAGHAGVILLRLPDQRTSHVRDALSRAVTRLVGVELANRIVVVQAGGIRLG